jgi:ATP-dependent RNA helicase DBP3
MSKDIIPQEEPTRSKKDKKQKKAKKSADPSGDEPRGLHISLQLGPLLTGQDKPAEKKDKKDKKKHKETHDPEVISTVSEDAKMDVDSESPQGICP